MAFARNVVVDVLLVFCRYLNPIRSVKFSGAAYSGYVHTMPDEFETASVHIRPICTGKSYTFVPCANLYVRGFVKRRIYLCYFILDICIN